MFAFAPFPFPSFPLSPPLSFPPPLSWSPPPWFPPPVSCDS
jgi:hypothetical protein